MDKLENEDRSNGTLVKDENIEDISSSLNPLSSSTKNGLNCKLCCSIFSSNNDLLNHIRKFKGRLGSCLHMKNITTTKRKNEESLLPENLIKQKLSRPTKIRTNPYTNSPTPDAISLYSQNIPITSKPPSNNLQSLHNTLIKSEYSCTKCNQVFRHNIGLICHLNSEHNDIVSNDISPTKLNKKCVNGNNKNEPKSDIINLTLVSDYKKDSLMNRIKSYVHNPKNGQVICVLCNTNFNNTKRAIAHVEDKHITIKIECGYCSMKFVYEFKLRSHMAKKHKIIRVYKCDKCSKIISYEECKSHSEKCEKIMNPIEIKKEED